MTSSILSFVKNQIREIEHKIGPPKEKTEFVFHEIEDGVYDLVRYYSYDKYTGFQPKEFDFNPLDLDKRCHAMIELFMPHVGNKSNPAFLTELEENLKRKFLEENRPDLVEKLDDSRIWGWFKLNGIGESYEKD